MVSSAYPSLALRIGTVGGLADLERVQMAVLPPHGGLDHPVDAAEGVGRRDEHLAPYRRVVDVPQRDPHLQHRIAGLRHAAETADREPAEIGEPGRVVRLVNHHDTEDTERRDRDRDVGLDRSLQHFHLQFAKPVEHIHGRDRVEGGSVEVAERAGTLDVSPAS